MARAHAKDQGGSNRREEPRQGDRAPSTYDKLDSYWWASTRPLPVLVFLLPLVLLYELGSAVYLTNPEAGTRKTIEAQKLFGDFFQALGVVGLFVPGVALVTVLLVWHVMTRDPWRVRSATLLGMLAESIAWALPLLVLSALYSRMSAMAGIGPEVALASAQGAVHGGLMAESWQARLTISIGAGLYEEMLFRLVGIALVHMVVRDLLGAKNWIACTVAVLGTAVAFALYHDPRLASGAPDIHRLVFITIAGAYLGNVYVLRGFGVVVGAHAIYDAMVLVFLAARS
ncbi:MAG: CPBP family intramembrane metalloprotease [Phycisphaeraceae bacterium]|nr:CPBP family intramembrane metalloprotease [Phycisphaeraceae bacterium]